MTLVKPLMIMLKRQKTMSRGLQRNNIFLVRKLYRDGDYRMSLLIGCGAFFGLRISDTLSLYRCYKDAAKEKNEIEKTFFPAYFFSFSKTFRIFAPSLLSKAESQ